MERALLDHGDSPTLSVFAQPELRRADRIKADLAALCGTGVWNSKTCDVFAISADRRAGSQSP
jgi:hypothetical protein